MGNHQGKGVGKAGCRHRVVDQPYRNQQYGGHDRCLHAERQRFADLCGGHAVGRKPACYDQRGNGDAGGIARRPAGDQHVGHHAQWQKEVERAGSELVPVDNIGLLNSDPVLHRLDADDKGNRQEIEDRRHDRVEHDRAIGNAGIGHHDKGAGAHNRRHDLTAGGGGCLDTGREHGAEAIRLHQRDGDNAG